MIKRFAALLLALTLLLGVSAEAAPVQLDSMDDVPATDESGFLPEGEDAVYYKDHAAGVWFYLDQTTRIEITRTQTKSPLLTYYLADIYVAEGSSLYTITWNESRPGRTNALPQEIAEKGHAVYAQSADFYSYRVSNDRYPGIIIRDGKTIYSKTYSKAVTAVPNLDTMAFYSSGKAEVNESWEVSAKEYQKRGASTVLAFGPILLRDGEMADLDKDAYNHKEPRSCFGIVDTGHYVGLLVEGRKNHSDGATLQTCAEILADFGCWDAINLDGGNTAAMLFMGESVQLTNAGGVDVIDRAVPDVLAVGTW